MSYAVKLPLDRKCKWYHNSINHYVARWQTDETLTYISYEEMFNVRLVSTNKGVVEVIFPSKDDAIMFMLRWS